MLGETAIAAVARGALDRSLPRARWTHEVHFAAVLWLLRHCHEGAKPDARWAVNSAYKAAKARLDDRQLADVIMDIMASSLV